MKQLVTAILFALITTTVFACDESKARNVQSMLQSMGTWNEKSGVTTFKWGAAWDDFAPHERKGMITAFADSDACLTGRPREINFYRKGKLVGKASPSSGIRVLD
jgi:hypothetical protein